VIAQTMHIAPPPSGFFFKTMYMAIRGQGALRPTMVAGNDDGGREGDCYGQR
jgi:hypothetical protein